MKIAQFIPFLTRGGAEKVAVNLANQLINSGHEVVIYLCYPNEDNFLLKDLDEKVDVLYVYEHKTQHALSLYINLLTWTRLNMEKLSQYDVIHCHLTFGSIFGSIFWLLGLFKNKAKFPIIIETNHSVGTNIKIWQKLMFQITKKMRNGYVLMAQDATLKNKMQTPPPFVRIIPNGVDIKNQGSVKPDRLLCDCKFNLNNNKFWICTIGRMVKERDPFSLVDVFNKVIQILTPIERDRIKFYWGGDGDARNSIVEKLIKLNIIRYFELPGMVHNSLELMSGSDLYVTMNVGNVTGISGLEAASVGVPVVAVQMIDDYIASDDDWIWSSNNTDEVAMRIVEYVRNPEKRESLAVAQKSYIMENLTSEVMVKKYVNFYREILSYYRLDN